MRTPQDQPVPRRLTQPLREYVETGRLPGGFLTAVLENDLRGAVTHADAESYRLLPAILRWLTWKVPYACWGSREKVEAWRDRLLSPHGGPAK